MATQKIEFKVGSLGTKDKILRPGIYFVDDRKFPELVDLARSIKGVTVTQEDEPKVVEVAEPSLLAYMAVTDGTEKNSQKSVGTDKPLATGGIIEGNGALLVSEQNRKETVPLVAKSTARTAAKRGRPRKTAVAA